MSFPKRNSVIPASLVLAFLLVLPAPGSGSPIPRGQDIQNILPEKERARFSGTTSVPEWDGQDVSISYEENAAYRADGCRFLDGRQTELILIR